MPRVIELLIVALIAVVALPLAVLVAVLVWRDLGRPLLFRQIRVGQGGRRIVLGKFRSMQEALDPTGIPLPDNERTTPTGRVLRRFRLDEIPQLMAILRGDLALVGPRPLLPRTIESFGAAGTRRCAVRPGLTGWAQVSGNSRLSDREKLALDLWYVAHRSLALDLYVVWLTLRTLLLGERREERRIGAAGLWLAQFQPTGAAEPLPRAEGQRR